MMNKTYLTAILLACTGNASAAAAMCPDVPSAPMTIYDKAENYAKSANFSLDENGILYYDYGGHHGGLGKWPNPFFASNYALALYRDWLNTDCTDENLKNQFLQQAKWLANTARVENGIASWPYPFRDNNFDLDPGWISGIGQSRIAGVLLRADAMTGDPQFHDMAEKALHAYAVDIKDGGVITTDGEVTWIEEMADPKGRSYKVLNGHITGLTGVLDLYNITKNQEWQKLYDRGVEAVRRDIHKFDAGFTSYYSIYMPSRDRPVAPLGNYNAHHVSQLLWMYGQDDDPRFLDYAMRFQAYEINKDKFDASGAIDPVNHGPSAVQAKYGSNYWSISKFPAWFTINSPDKELIRGLAIDVNDVSEYPANFVVSAEIDGEFKTVANSPKITSKSIDVIFDKPILTSRIKIDIPAPSAGKKLVAFKSVMLLRENIIRAPVANECNHTHNSRKKVNPNNIDSAYDANLETIMSVLCDGWVVSPISDPGNIISATFIDSDGVKFYGSDDLSLWMPLNVKKEAHRVSARVKYNYVKIDFPKEVKGIAEVEETKPGLFSLF